MTHARFPDVPLAKGHYESYYLRAVHPDRPLGVWLRHTVLKRPGEAAVGSVWLTVFDAGRDGPPAAFKESAPEPPSAAPGGHGVTIGASTFTLAGVSGESSGGGARWNVTFADGAPALAHLPRGWMYRTPLPRTKSGSVHPVARLSGEVALNERTIQMDGWPGMVGHNWGAEHAERWIWLHGVGFEDAPDAWLDVVCGRIRIAGRTTPWVANGALHLDGTRHRLGGLGAVRATRVREEPERAELVLPGSDGLRVRAAVTDPAGHAVVWRYADPAGPEHHVANCSIARLELTLGPSGRRLVTPHGAAYELGMHETGHGLPVQPYPDP